MNSISKDRILNGLTFEKYFNDFEKYAESLPVGSGDYDKAKLNLQRMRRILKTYTPSDEIKSIASSLKEDQIWMLITENWCGDSAQTVPFIHLISELSPGIILRILERDKNLDIMDIYLTNGGRSIPKLVAFNNNMEELFQWGARPKAAQDLFARLKSEGIEKEKIIEQIHLWYGRNRGKDIESEFIKLLL